MVDPLEVIAAESERFVRALQAADPSATVPAAPDWSADDLLWHLTEGQWFWAAIVAGRLAEPDGAEAASPARPTDRGELVDLARSGTRALLDALAGADDDEPAWTWADDRSVGFIRRRQMHEVVIHRVDAEQTAGTTVTPIHPQVAADGVDEVLNVFLSGAPDWMTFRADGTTVAFVSDDADRRWSFAFGRVTGTSPTTGHELDLPALAAVDASTGGPSRPDAVIAGAASDVLLWLWGRADLGPLTVDGDARVADRVREVVADATG